MNDTINNLKRRQNMNAEYYEHIDNVDCCKKIKIDKKMILMPIHLVTCGLQGNDLGRDETAILQICVQLIDVLKMEIIGEKIITLQASSLLDKEANPEKIHISIPARELIGLNYFTTIDSYINLSQAIDFINCFITEKTLNKDYKIEIIPVTVGHLPLRSVLHREARFRNIVLPKYWYNYFDLFEQMFLCFKTTYKSLDEICSVLQLVKCDISSGIIFNISQACLCLLKHDHNFISKQTVMTEYKPAVFHVNDPIEEDVVVMIKPIDYKTPISQVLPFFNGLNIADGGVAVIMLEGRRSNKILVRFVNKIQRDIALLRDKHHLELGSTRYITMSTFESQYFMKIAGCEDEIIREYLFQLTCQSQVLLRMKGLPFTVTKGDIIKFFNSNDTIVKLGISGIFLVQKQSGDLNGDAFIIFDDEFQASKATNLKGSLIGNRYVEIFHSTPAEMNQVIAGIKVGTNQSRLLKKSNKNKEMENIDSLQIMNQNHLSLLNGGFIQNNKMGSVGAATMTTLIPKDATDSDFVNFLGECQRNCVTISRYNLNNSKGYTSYIAGFKGLEDAELSSKFLMNKSFKMELISKEFQVKTLVLPLTSGFMPNIYNPQNQMIQKVPLNTMNIMPTSFPFISPIFHSPIGIQNLLQIPNLNLGSLSNLYAMNQFNQLSVLPSILQSGLINNQIPSKFSIQTPVNQCYISPSNFEMNGINQNMLMQNFSSATNLSPQLFFERANTLMLHGVQIQLLQYDADAIFQSLIPYISVLPKLYQSNQTFYVMFITPEDAKIALLRCPIILYKNQTIQLVSIN